MTSWLNGSQQLLCILTSKGECVPMVEHDSKHIKIKKYYFLIRTFLEDTSLNGKNMLSDGIASNCYKMEHSYLLDKGSCDCM